MNSNNPLGTKFKFQTCNFDPPGYNAYQDQGEGYDAGCPTYYIDFIRIISPTSGDCLTQKPLPNSNLVELVPKKCNPNPTDTSQLFIANQQVLYSCFGGEPRYAHYYPAGLYAIDADNVYGDQWPATSWVLAANGKTVQYFIANGTESNLNAVINVESGVV